VKIKAKRKDTQDGQFADLHEGRLSLVNYDLETEQGQVEIQLYIPKGRSYREEVYRFDYQELLTALAKLTGSK
jgi:hypothetical protein